MALREHNQWTTQAARRADGRRRELRERMGAVAMILRP